MSTSQEFEKISYRRNDFYRNQFRRMVSFLIVLLFISGGLLTTYILVAGTQAPARYYASTTTGDVVPIESLSSPVVTMDFIRQWAETVARSAYSLDFLSYSKQLQNTQQYFTPDGWIAFQSALDASGLLNDIKANKLYLSAIANGPVVVVNRYISGGRYTWDIQVPLLISFTSSNVVKKKQIYVSMTIKRVPELEEARGIAVTKFIRGGDKLNG